MVPQEAAMNGAHERVREGAIISDEHYSAKKKTNPREELKKIPDHSHGTVACFTNSLGRPSPA